ncbi:PUS3 [Symbiodinium natans]|uniref:tRNA pseudouridine synthase n=1 Tax=Symbiodinium natans TaxID=878477 RepID=A0A812NGD1_9DINO|nr:PUS3 [Symbiodinium natans]
METTTEATGKETDKKRKKGSREFDWTKATFGHYVLKLAYVGTNYHGLAWQEPSTCPTVEAALFEALQKTRLVKDRQSCNFSRCGRTDKGVHAAGNYISLNLRLKPASQSGSEGFDYPSILNGVLPPDIRILAAAPAPSGFDARFSCLFRAYQYYFPHAGEDLQKMQEAAAHFVGEHDFRNFCKMDVENITNYRRRVLSVSVRLVSDGVAEFAVTGLAFLWHQVRCMAAVLLLVGQGLETPSVVEALLDVERCPRKPLYEPADESGLVLRDCGFEGVAFAPSTPKPAGESGLPTPSSAADTFRSLRDRQLRAFAVASCMLTACGGEPTGREREGKRKHVPLLQRPGCPTLQEKQEAFEARRQRRKPTEAEEARE